MGIRRYIFKYIQNLNKVLADLERARVTIAGAKSQFCRFGIKSMRYIYDADGCYPEISKVFKIIDWLKCTDITLAYVFIGICIYYQI